MCDVQRFARPGWRLLGSFVSWALFMFCFVALYQVASVVSGLGGFCASGGPYVIETECPESVVVLAPGSVPGMFVAGAIALAFARGFGTPLITWAWSILFVGLGIQFAMSALRGDVAGILLAILFIGMGAVPLVWVLRTGAVAAFVGTHTVRDEPFAGIGDAPRTPFGLGRSAPAEQSEAVPLTPGRVAVSLGVPVLAIVVGSWLALAAFRALALAG